jgi:hypothetical protein
MLLVQVLKVTQHCCICPDSTNTNHFSVRARTGIPSNDVLVFYRWNTARLSFPEENTVHVLAQQECTQLKLVILHTFPFPVLELVIVRFFSFLFYSLLRILSARIAADHWKCVCHRDSRRKTHDQYQPTFPFYPLDCCYCHIVVVDHVVYYSCPCPTQDRHEVVR